MKEIRPNYKKWKREYDVVTEAEIGSAGEVFRERQAVIDSREFTYSGYMLSDMHMEPQSNLDGRELTWSLLE